MKKIIFFSLLIFLFCSCSKSDDSAGSTAASNTVSATINGVAHVWNVTPHCTVHDNSGISGDYQLINITAYDGVTSTASGVYLSIFQQGAITMKTFGEYTGGDGAQFSYIDNGSPIVYGTANDPGNPLVLTVTKLTSTVIEGEFHGTIHKSSDVTEDARVITNGKFSLTKGI